MQQRWEVPESLAVLEGCVGLFDFILSAQLLPIFPGRELQDGCLQPCFMCHDGSGFREPCVFPSLCMRVLPPSLCVVVISLSASSARLFEHRDVKSRGGEGSCSFH